MATAFLGIPVDSLRDSSGKPKQNPARKKACHAFGKAGRSQHGTRIQDPAVPQFFPKHPPPELLQFVEEKQTHNHHSDDSP
jgi:hypothetical protein